jgi:hypothetical protein
MKLSAKVTGRVIKSYRAGRKLREPRSLTALHKPPENSPMDTATDTVSNLTEQLAQTAESQRALVNEITVFAKDETLRFLNLRMDRNSAALEKLQTCQGLAGLIGVQQEWLRDLMQDYSDLGQRNASALRGVAHTVAAKATDAANDTVDRMHAQAQDNLHQGAQMVAETEGRFDNAVQDVDQPYVQTQH